MGIGAYGRGGETGSGPSSVFLDHPWKGYRDWGDDRSGAWKEEWIDSLGRMIDILKLRFCSTSARVALLDPMTTTSEVATDTMATPIAAPKKATTTDTMLDLLCYIAGVPTPIDTNLTVAQKQSLVIAGWTMLARKGTRTQVLRLASIFGGDVAAGWTTPPWSFASILPDGCPSPGWGSWVPLTPPAITRPWVFSSLRNHLTKRLFPSWVGLGVGYSVFRAGYSATGEVVAAATARINLLSGEHFDTWAGSPSAPTGWTYTPSGAAHLSALSSDAYLNSEFTAYVAKINLAAVAAGLSDQLSQVVVVNNQVTYRFELDYLYAGTVSNLLVQIVDTTSLDSTLHRYWNPTTETWGTAVYSISIPASTTRDRYSCDVTPQASSTTDATPGTGQITVKIITQSDGTTASQIAYKLYRVGFYEKFSPTIEIDAGGERTLWLLLEDGLGPCTFTRAAGPDIIEPASADRSSYKRFYDAGWISSPPEFPYHGALSARGYRSCSSGWTNLLAGSNDFNGAGSDWTLVNAAATASSVVSPIVGETSATATSLEGGGGGTAPSIYQPDLIADPNAKSYLAGVWVKKITTDADFQEVTLTLEAIGGVTSKTVTYTMTTAGGWQLLVISAVSFVAGDSGCPLRFTVGWGDDHPAGTSGIIAVASAYVYDVTGKTDVLYPPVIQTAIGSTDAAEATTCIAVVSGANLHSLTQRPLTTLANGLLNLTVVPTFSANSQPDQTIFDFGQNTTTNRFVLRIVSGVLQVTIFDSSTGTHTASITLTEKSDPATGECTWLRDTAIAIHCRWSSTTGLDVTAGNGNANQVSSLPWTVSDASLAGIGIGNTVAGAGQFDGLITGVEVI